MMTLFAALTLAAAVGPVCVLVCARITDRRQWLGARTCAAAISASALLIGPWALVSVYLRPIIAVAVISVLILTARRAVRQEIQDHQCMPSPSPSIRYVVSACFFIVVLINALAGGLAPPVTVDLRFPLKGGMYAVLQGGGSLVLNPFHRWFRADKYALDVVRLNVFGNRARGIAPARLIDYVSFNDSVYSPCTGVSEEVRSDVLDNPPGDTDPQHRTGNYVLLRCGTLRVLLAHLGRGTVVVSAGDTVRVGQLLGRIGNSGYTIEPHLHVSAMAAGSAARWPDAEPVPVTFDGRFLVINDIVR